MAQRIFFPFVIAVFLAAAVLPPASVAAASPGSGIAGSLSFDALASRSQAAYDGWILESNETSGAGGSINATSTVFRLGDDARDRQYRAILSFNTASLPDTAVITAVTLRIKRQGMAGTNPFTTHGRILVDIREGAFSANNGLQANDFQAAASRNRAGLIANNPQSGQWYSVSLDHAAFAYVNLSGLTQFRLRFATDDNDDNGADYLQFYSGNAAAAYRPQLTVEYLLPPLPPSETNCPPLPPPAGPTVTVSTEAELRAQASSAAPGTTILVAPGVYNLQDAIWVTANGIAIRGATGNRDDVILDGGGMLTWTRTHVIAIDADDVTIADLTIRNGDEHGVSVQGRDRPTLYNLHIVNTGYQLVKVNPVGDGSDDGLLACSRLEYTTASPEEYTNGISAHNAHRWTVRDNEWYRIRTPGNASVPTILFWSGSSDTVVERNLLVDCYQGISFGNASHGPGDHTGGIVRNNFIYASQPHDSVIEMVHATGWLVANNTALLLHPNGLDWGMEARFSDTTGTFAYNLTNLRIWNDRDGAQGNMTGNITNAESGWFVNPSAADLHLLASATAAIDHAASLPQVTDDYDAQSRPSGSAPDVGADEYTVAGGSLIQPADFEYLGAFRLPGGDTRPQTFAYGGNAMTFNPDGDPGGAADGFPGSLFITGHDRLPYGELPNGGQIAEVSIPLPSLSRNTADLPQAEFRQNFRNALGSRFTPMAEIPRIGLLYLSQPLTGPQIHVAYGQHLEPVPPAPTHGWFSPTLASPNFQGEWFLAGQSFYSVNDYMLEIPAAWADAYAQGRYVGTGRFKDGGWSGMGPVLIAYRPWNADGSPPPNGASLASTTLLRYASSTESEDINYHSLHGYQHPDEWNGGAWLTTASGKSALLFAGTKSNGTKFWYGYVNPRGPQYPCVDGDVADFVTCRMADGSACPPQDFNECSGHNGYRGWWTTRWDSQFILYDPADLARVASGELASWQPQPYAVLDIDEHLFFNPSGVELDMLGTGDQRRYRIGDVAYDRVHGLLYVLELFADGAKPVVHVWRVR